MQWIAQTHLFNHPFYYIEYAIAQLSALQVWQHYRKDRGSALQAYKRGPRLGGSRPLPELFAAMNVRLDLTAATLKPLVDDIMAKIDA